MIDATPIQGLYVKAGHGALGWTLACGSAELLAQIVAGRTPAGHSPYRLQRRRW